MDKFENYSTWWKSPIFKILAMVILTLLVIGEAVYIGNSIKSGRYIGRASNIRDTISMNGEGKITAIPDIANVTIGINVEKKSVAEAQKENTNKFNALLAQFKKQGIDSKDIKTTDYRINPVYDYTSSRGQTLRGYEVNQSVSIKIRNLDKISDVLDIAGQGGANQVSGLTFSIDDPEKLRQQAREKAFANAREKAAALAEVSGVKLGKVVSFSESGGNQPQPYPMYYAKDSLGMGGAGPILPSIEGGSLDIVVNANITYEIY